MPQKDDLSLSKEKLTVYRPRAPNWKLFGNEKKKASAQFAVFRSR